MKDTLTTLFFVALGLCTGWLIADSISKPRPTVITGVMVYEVDVTHHRLPISDANGTFIYTDTIPRDTIIYPVDHPRMLKYIQLLKCIGQDASDYNCERCWDKVYNTEELRFIMLDNVSYSNPVYGIK